MRSRRSIMDAGLSGHEYRGNPFMDEYGNSR
jgi:hypothetical protein